MSFGPFSVLVIDDSYVTRNIFELVFEHYGLPLVAASDEETALNYLERFTPALIVVDLYLGDGDGWTILEHLRDVGYCGPVVATTSYHTSWVWSSSFISGFDGYLPKPYDVKSLVPYLYGLWKMRQ